jgi:hypothetical protein
VTLHNDITQLAAQIHAKGQAEYTKAILAKESADKTRHKYRAIALQEAALAINQVLAAHGERTSYEAHN